MALPVLDGNQSATTLSSVVTGGEHIVAHTVVSLGSTAISNITSAVSGSVVSVSNFPATQTISGTVTASVVGSVTVGSLPDISGTVTANAYTQIFGLTSRAKLASKYSFNASTKTITLQTPNQPILNETTALVPRERILGIANITRAVIYYHPTDPTKTFSSYSQFTPQSMTLNASVDTSSHSNSDALAIFYDDNESVVVQGSVEVASGKLRDSITLVGGGVITAGQNSVGLYIPDYPVGTVFLIKAELGGATYKLTTARDSILSTAPLDQTMFEVETGTAVTQTSATEGLFLWRKPPGGGANGLFTDREYVGLRNVSGSATAGWSLSVVNSNYGLPLPISGTVTIGSSVTVGNSVTIGAMPNGALTTRFGSVTTANTAEITSAVTNSSRKYLLIQNVTTQSNVITVGIGFTPTTTQGIQLTAGAGITFESSYIPTGAVYVLSSVTASNFTILEA